MGHAWGGRACLVSFAEDPAVRRRGAGPAGRRVHTDLMHDRASLDAPAWRVRGAALGNGGHGAERTVPAGCSCRGAVHPSDDTVVDGDGQAGTGGQWRLPYMGGTPGSPGETGYRSVAPVAFATAATTFWQAASISASVRVRSRGWNVTSTASDVLPSGSLSPV